MALRRGFGRAARDSRFPDMSDQELVDALQEIEDGLSESELRFVDDIGRRFAEDPMMRLTPRQRKWAEDIWERAG